MKRLLIALIVVCAVAAGWFFVSPLFIDESVDEAFDFMQADGSIDLDAVMALPAGQRLAMMDEVMSAAANAADRSAMEPMPAAAPRALVRGEFVDADAIHKGSGQATMYVLPDNNHAIRLEDFRTTNGPALVVYLSTHANPQTADDVSDNKFVNLGKLKGNVGNQNYAIPAGTDIQAFKSVVIWCELFGVLFSPAALTPVG